MHKKRIISTGGLTRNTDLTLLLKPIPKRGEVSIHVALSFFLASAGFRHKGHTSGISKRLTPFTDNVKHTPTTPKKAPAIFSSAWMAQKSAAR